MRIITKHNRSTVTFVEEIHPGGSKAPGVMLDILGSDSDNDDMYAYAWLSMEEVKELADGLVEETIQEVKMRFHKFPSLVTGNRIRRLRLALQDRREGEAKTPNVAVKAIDLEYILDYVRDLEGYKNEIEELFELEIIS